MRTTLYFDGSSPRSWIDRAVGDRCLVTKGSEGHAPVDRSQVRAFTSHRNLSLTTTPSAVFVAGYHVQSICGHLGKVKSTQ
jgi:hypothetical protein